MPYSEKKKEMREKVGRKRRMSLIEKVNGETDDSIPNIYNKSRTSED